MSAMELRRGRYRTVICLAALALAACLVTPAPAQDRRTNPPAERGGGSASKVEPAAERDKAIEQKMSKTMAEFSCEETPLEDAIAFFREWSGLNIHVKWNMLEVEGITRDTPVTVGLREVTFEKALQTVLEDVRGPLGYVVDEGVITITTRDEIWRNERYYTTRVYDVRDLVDWTYEEAMAELVNVIQETVDPDSWRPMGFASIRPVQGTLVVAQTRKNHEAIEELLSKLETIGKVRPKTPPARTKYAQAQIKLVGTMKETCFDPAGVGLIAIAGIRDEVPREAEQIIEDLEQQLTQTTHVGLRNAIRLALKDLYKARGQDEKVLATLREMLHDNNRALEGEAPARETGGTRATERSRAPTRRGDDWGRGGSD